MGVADNSANIDQRGSPRLVTSSRKDHSAMDESKSMLNTFRLHEATGTDHRVGNQDDRDIANCILAAMTELQKAMDGAVLAGLIVEPNFARIENRLTQCGMRIDSFVCKVGVYRKLA